MNRLKKLVGHFGEGRAAERFVVPGPTSSGGMPVPPKPSSYNALTSALVEKLRGCVSDPKRCFWKEGSEKNTHREVKNHETDKSHHGNYAPEMVIYPKSSEEVAKILPICSQQKIPGQLTVPFCWFLVRLPFSDNVHNLLTTTSQW